MYDKQNLPAVILSIVISSISVFQSIDHYAIIMYMVLVRRDKAYSTVMEEHGYGESSMFLEYSVLTLKAKNSIGLSTFTTRNGQ